MISLLHDDPAENARMLDDFNLNQQIKAIAQTLCNVHYAIAYLNNIDASSNIPLPPNKAATCVFTKLASTCRANYLKLVDTGLACLNEYEYRFIIGCGCNDCDFRDKKLIDFDIKYREVIEWARDNVPILDKWMTWARDPNGFLKHEKIETGTPFPLVMPEKYAEIKDVFDIDYESAVINSYRNYYRAKLQRLICPKCKTGMSEEGCSKNGIIWTRREKPDWL